MGEMLVAVQQHSRFSPRNVIIKCREALVRAVITLVHHTWRVVREKKIHGRKCGERCGDLLLFEEVMSARFVPPRPAKTADPESTEGMHLQVRVLNWCGKWRRTVVISLHGKNRRRAMRFRCAQQQRIR